MSWTVLRVAAEGVVLRGAHAQRFAAAPDAVREAFDRFCGGAVPGIYALREASGALYVEARPTPWLVEGMPVRLRASPVGALRGLLPKPASPSVYDTIRERGTCTLLTSLDGHELFEACTAALMSWDGTRVVFPPADRPRVASASEVVVRSALPFVERPLAVRSDAPLVAVNAVSGAVPLVLEGRRPMPGAVLEAVAAAFRAATGR